jgi:hypothetical protein
MWPKWTPGSSFEAFLASGPECCQNGPQEAHLKPFWPQAQIVAKMDTRRPSQSIRTNREQQNDHEKSRDSASQSIRTNREQPNYHEKRRDSASQSIPTNGIQTAIDSSAKDECQCIRRRCACAAGERGCDSSEKSARELPVFCLSLSV